MQAMSEQKMVLNGRYELLERIGSGGMSVVYKAQDRALGRIVAVKMMHESFTNDSGFLALVGNLVLPYLVLRWFCEKLRVGPDGPFLSFMGDFLPYLGWMAIGFLSIFTIVGWAWFLQYYLDWVCRNVAGPVRFSFHGRGLEILWRCVVAVLGFCLIIPIPWVLAWLTRWFVSQIQASTAEAA